MSKTWNRTLKHLASTFIYAHGGGFLPDSYVGKTRCIHNRGTKQKCGHLIPSSFKPSNINKCLWCQYPWSDTESIVDQLEDQGYKSVGWSSFLLVLSPFGESGSNWLGRCWHALATPAHPCSADVCKSRSPTLPLPLPAHTTTTHHHVPAVNSREILSAPTSHTRPRNSPRDFLIIKDSRYCLFSR